MPAWQSRARQWSRAAWGLAALFASLPLANRLAGGGWGFQGAAELSGICLFLGIYLHIVAQRRSPAIPDGAAMLDRAIRLASSGQIDPAILLLSKAIRLSPEFWQAFQYRGELYLRQRESWDAAIRDCTEAIRLAPQEPHLYLLRAQAHRRLGDEASALRDCETAAIMGGRGESQRNLEQQGYPLTGDRFPIPDQTVRGRF